LAVSSYAFNALTLLVGWQQSIWPVKMSDEVMTWFSVWGEMQRDVVTTGH